MKWVEMQFLIVLSAVMVSTLLFAPDADTAAFLEIDHAGNVIDTHTGKALEGLSDAEKAEIASGHMSDLQEGEDVLEHSKLYSEDSEGHFVNALTGKTVTGGSGFQEMSEEEMEQFALQHSEGGFTQAVVTETQATQDLKQAMQSSGATLQSADTQYVQSLAQEAQSAETFRQAEMDEANLQDVSLDSASEYLAQVSTAVAEASDAQTQQQLETVQDQLKTIRDKATQSGDIAKVDQVLESAESLVSQKLKKAKPAKPLTSAESALLERATQSVDFLELNIDKQLEADPVNTEALNAIKNQIEDMQHALSQGNLKTETEANALNKRLQRSLDAVNDTLVQHQPAVEESPSMRQKFVQKVKDLFEWFKNKVRKKPTVSQVDAAALQDPTLFSTTVTNDVVTPQVDAGVKQLEAVANNQSATSQQVQAALDQAVDTYGQVTKEVQVQKDLQAYIVQQSTSAPLRFEMGADGQELDNMQVRERLKELFSDPTDLDDQEQEEAFYENMGKQRLGVALEGQGASGRASSLEVAYRKKQAQATLATVDQSVLNLESGQTLVVDDNGQIVMKNTDGTTDQLTDQQYAKLGEDYYEKTYFENYAMKDYTKLSQQELVAFADAKSKAMGVSTAEGGQLRDVSLAARNDLTYQDFNNEYMARTPKINNVTVDPSSIADISEQAAEAGTKISELEDAYGTLAKKVGAGR